jgi:hypothetical protein
MCGWVGVVRLRAPCTHHSSSARLAYTSVERRRITTGPPPRGSTLVSALSNAPRAPAAGSPDECWLLAAFVALCSDRNTRCHCTPRRGAFRSKAMKHVLAAAPAYCSRLTAPSAHKLNSTTASPLSWPERHRRTHGKRVRWGRCLRDPRHFTHNACVCGHGETCNSFLTLQNKFQLFRPS